MSAIATFVWLSISLGGAMRVAEGRVIQFMSAVTLHQSAEDDRQLQALLRDDEQWMLLRNLPDYDRRHHLLVWKRLHDSGHRDQDLLRAALLHDIGKADERGRVYLAHRVVRVLGRRFAPGVLAWLASLDDRFLGHGLYLAEHHATLGAQLARETGASERCCYLIAAHEQGATTADPSLKALYIADREAHR